MAKAKKTTGSAGKIEAREITSREEWFAWRRQDVTASAVAALLGAHPYQTAFGLYEEKTGVAEPQEESGPMRRGRLMEPVALQILREDYPDIRFEPSKTYYRDPVLGFGATPDIDAFCQKRGRGLVQVKSVAPQIFNSETWNKGETPPLFVLCQAIAEHHLVGDAKWAAVAPVVAGFGIECPLIEIPLDNNAPRVLANMREAVAEFWAKVATKTPPAFDFKKDGARIAALYEATTETTIDLSRDNRAIAAHGELIYVRERKKLIVAEEEALKAEITAKMGPHEVAYIGEGRVLTNKTQHRKGYTVEPSSFRVIRASIKGA
jgi:putative phage-type endonuclease